MSRCPDSNSLCLCLCLCLAQSNMKILAEKSGFTVARKAKGPKLKPNAPCECGSGKKQKKCCGMEKAE